MAWRCVTTLALLMMHLYVLHLCVLHVCSAPRAGAALSKLMPGIPRGSYCTVLLTFSKVRGGGDGNNYLTPSMSNAVAVYKGKSTYTKSGYGWFKSKLPFLLFLIPSKALISNTSLRH